MPRWDEFTHGSAVLYRFRQRCLMEPLKWVAKLTPWFDQRELLRYRSAQHAMWKRFLSGARVLEVGCGPGTFGREVIDLYGAREYTGVDASWGMTRDARAAGLRSVVTARAEALPFKDCSWDVVLTCYMFHHIPPGDRVRAIRELVRVSAGVVIVEDLYGFSGGVLRWPYEIYYRVVDGSYYRYTLGEWQRVLEGIGLSLIEHDNTGEKTPAYRFGRWIVAREPCAAG